MQAFAVWIPEADRWAVLRHDHYAPPRSTASAVFVERLRTRVVCTTALPAEWDRARAASPLLRYIAHNLSATGGGYLNDRAPTLAEFLKDKVPHVLALVASSDLSPTELATVCTSWLAAELCKGKSDRFLVRFVETLRTVAKPGSLHRALLAADDALVSHRAWFRANAVLGDGGALLCTNKALPLSRAACAMVASMPLAQTTLLTAASDLLDRNVCPRDAFCGNARACAGLPLCALHALDPHVVCTEDRCAILARLPPRLAPALVGEDEPPAAGWAPEEAMSAALFGNPGQPCVRGVVLFNFFTAWTTQFKKRGWVFGDRERLALMRAADSVRPLTREHARFFVRWCVQEDERNFSGSTQAERRASMLRVTRGAG